MRNLPKNRLWAPALALLLALVLGLAALQRLLVPKYMGASREGALAGEYYGEKGGHQVIFLGDCEAYETFSPVALWRALGVSSYVRGGPGQRVWQSYYLLEDTLRWEQPELVVFSVYALCHARAESEAYNRLNLDGMAWGAAKWKAVAASRVEGESLLSYLFPLLRYHSRWMDLGPDDLRYFWGPAKVAHGGYLMHSGVQAPGDIPAPRPLGAEKISEKCWEYLEKMRLLCREAGAQLVLVKAPVLYPHWYPLWEEEVEVYAAEKGLLYINLLEHREEMGLDYALHTYDGGLHLNRAGAELATAFVGRRLAEEYALADSRGNTALAARWEKLAAAYDEEAARQEKALAGAG